MSTMSWNEYNFRKFGMTKEETELLLDKSQGHELIKCQMALSKRHTNFVTLVMFFGVWCVNIIFELEFSFTQAVYVLVILYTLSWIDYIKAFNRLRDPLVLREPRNN